MDNPEIGQQNTDISDRIVQNISDKEGSKTYPLLGPLGAKKGQTMPTIPHSTVKTVIGTKETPILRWYLDLSLNYRISNKHQLNKNGGGADYVGSTDCYSHMTLRRFVIRNLSSVFMKINCTYVYKNTYLSK